MPRIRAFVEDEAHRRVIEAVGRRMSSQMDVPIELLFNVCGGSGAVLSTCKRYARAILSDKATDDDGLLVAIDANCKGYNEKKREIEVALEWEGARPSDVVYAIPDPHIERWLLLDAGAVGRALSHPVTLRKPPKKCERNFYKNQPFHVVESARLQPLFGGLEHAEAIVAEYDLTRPMPDPAFHRFLDELRTLLNKIRT